MLEEATPVMPAMSPVERDAHRHDVRPGKGDEREILWPKEESGQYGRGTSAEQCAA